MVCLNRCLSKYQRDCRAKRIDSTANSMFGNVLRKNTIAELRALDDRGSQGSKKKKTRKVMRMSPDHRAL